MPRIAFVQQGSLALIVLAAGCGGGSSQAVRNLAPSVTLALEGPSITDAATTTLHGRTTGSAAIAEVRAGGVLAASADGFATFGLQLPLTTGANAFDLTARDARGRTTTLRSPSIRRETPLLRFVGGCSADPSGNDRLAVSTVLPGEVHFVDPTTGDRTLLSGPTRGSGPLFETVHAVAITDDGLSVLVDATSPSAIFVVDARTGDRTLLPRSALFAAGLAHDPFRARVAYTNNFPSVQEVRVIPLAGGADTLLSDGTDGTSAPMARPTGIVHDLVDDLYLVLAEGSRTLLRVSPVNGVRKVTSDFADPTQGPTVDVPCALAFDTNARRAYVLEQLTGDLIEIDVKDGKRRLALAGDEALGPTLLFGFALAFDPDSGKLHAPRDQALVTIDLVARRRSPLAEVRLGAGEPLEFSPYVAFDRTRDRLLLTVQYHGLSALDLATADRELLLVEESAQPRALFPDDVAPSADARRLFATESQAGRIVAIDAQSRVLTEVSSATRGAGPPLADLRRLTVDPAGGRLFVLDQFGQRVVAVDLATGDRTVIAAQGDGRPVPLSFLIGLECDPVSGRLVALDVAQPGLVLIDPDDGTRELFADVSDGSMPDVLKGFLCLDGPTRSCFVVGESDQPFAYQIVRVDLDDATRAVITGPGVGSGPPLGSISALECDGANGRLFALDMLLRTVMQVDVDSGDRVIIAR